MFFLPPATTARNDAGDRRFTQRQRRNQPRGQQEAAHAVVRRLLEGMRARGDAVTGQKGSLGCVGVCVCVCVVIMCMRLVCVYVYVRTYDRTYSRTYVLRYGHDVTAERQNAHQYRSFVPFRRHIQPSFDGVSSKPYYWA